MDEYEDYVEAEKQAAEEIEAGGRLFARAMIDELDKLAGDEEEEVVEEEPKSLSEKLFGESE